VQYGDGNCQGSNCRRTKISNSGLSSNWHHVAAVIQGPNNIEIYIDGKNDGGTYSGSGGNLTYSNASGNIGLANISSGFFAGKIDDVRIYNYALSAEQVKQVYNGGAVTFR